MMYLKSSFRWRLVQVMSVCHFCRNCLKVGLSSLFNCLTAVIFYIKRYVHLISCIVSAFNCAQLRSTSTGSCGGYHRKPSRFGTQIGKPYAGNKVCIHWTISKKYQQLSQTSPPICAARMICLIWHFDTIYHSCNRTMI